MLSSRIARYCATIDDSPSDLVGAYDGTYVGGMGTVADTSHGGTRAYEFDGSDDRLQVPGLYVHDGSADFPFTLSFWIKANSPSSAQTWVGNYTGTPPGISIGTYANKIYAGCYSNDAPGYASCRVTVPYTSTAWHHIAFSYDGGGLASGIALYIDGARQIETDASEANYLKMSVINGNLNIGSRAYNQRFSGRMDDIMAFDAVVSALDIAAIHTDGPGYIAPAPPPPPPSPKPRSIFSYGRLFAA